LTLSPAMNTGPGIRVRFRGFVIGFWEVWV
jgi:hypothetical protein